MFVVGLTGGIASGKSTVARLFARRGADVIDTDAVAREVVRPGSDGLTAVVDAFGKDVLTQDHCLDRRALRALIFDDEAARRRLESILHPRIEAAVRERIAASPGPYIVLVVPLLVESGWHEWVDRVAVVDVEEAHQIERLAERDDHTHEQARAALAAQTSRAHRLAHADDVIDNRGPPEALRDAVDALHERYLALATGGR
ncbi:dephospho-CoA kinase [Arhodomonas aquaeolei]|uniref:dephospho-CoA kinase n=1 Tax=Arhodomonas aquaeolei TaxID=2369 RepID=UPI0003611A83|nr:dephospho-CoA kinase [Arhodomonas aquaeolei]